MSDLNCANLIDLSLEDSIPRSNNEQIKTENALQPSETSTKVPIFIPSTLHKSSSLDNNPFDCAQKLADHFDNPFDIVEKEACLKGQLALKPRCEVKLGNLLFLNEEEEMSTNKLKDTELELVSPPDSLYEKLECLSSDTDLNSESSTECSVSSKSKKNLDNRMTLLKKSVSNAAFSSPIGRKLSMEFEGVLGTPVSSTLSRAAEFGEHLLALESPLKLVEDEDIMSQERLKLLDSEKKFKQDLEMLKIPILNKLRSPVVEQISIKSPKSSTADIQKTEPVNNVLLDLEVIKEKIKAKNKGSSNNSHQQEISSLIHNLKSLISSDMVDNSKKQQASDLLESLSFALKPVVVEETLKPPDLVNVPLPQPIKREGTFNMDLQKNEENNIDNQPLMEEIPKCMISSSATYDAEMDDDKDYSILPEIDPLSPQITPSQYLDYQQDSNEIINENHLQSDVNDFVEQLNKLLINNSSDKTGGNQNPTFIVVMNTNQLNCSNINNSQQNLVDAKQRSAFVANYLENSINDGSPDLTKVNPMPRRRAQSLSIHDKVKIVQLPLLPTPRPLQKQQNVQCDDSPPVTTPPPTADRKTLEFKTPARIPRRNTYSSGTPYTAQVGVRRTEFKSELKNPSSLRKPQTLETYQEVKHETVRPLSKPSNNLPTFKPDLKKKTKHKTESIIKSSGPLKAIMPLKKVTPMLKTSPPTPDNNAKPFTSRHNISPHSNTKIGKVPSTPLPTKGGTSELGVCYPNACSTPAAFTSPLKRTIGGVSKPRYSATPNPKSSVTNPSTSGPLRRRTITEFKAKTPIKPRVSSVGLAAAFTSSKSEVGSSRLSISAGARFSKTPIKTTSNASIVKPVSRLHSRTSVGGSSLSAINKENKRP